MDRKYLNYKFCEPLRIYVAGPYTAETPTQRIKNVKTAIDAGIIIYHKGHFPYIPHLTHFIDERAKEIGVRLTWEDYIRWDLSWLDFCDAILCLGRSKGVDIEMRKAEDLEKLVFYSIEEIPVLIKTNSQTTALPPSQDNFLPK